jgi:hypothetical protein
LIRKVLVGTISQPIIENPNIVVPTRGSVTSQTMEVPEEQQEYEACAQHIDFGINFVHPAANPCGAHPYSRLGDAPNIEGAAVGRNATRIRIADRSKQVVAYTN